MKNVYYRKETHNKIKKAKRKAAAMPPSRSDRWQANFLAKKFAQSDSTFRSAAVNGRTAAGSAADFYGKGDFLNIDSHA